MIFPPEPATWPSGHPPARFRWRRINLTTLRAAELGMTAIAITNRNSVAGVVRVFPALQELARLRDAEAAADEGPAVRAQQVTDAHSCGKLPLPRLKSGSEMARMFHVTRRRAFP